MGNFSNASLNGHYAYQMTGFDLFNGTSFSEGGVFTADGAGNITSGTDDFVETTGFQSTPITGTYTVANDGTAVATLNFSGGGSLVLGMTLVSSSKAYLIEGDQFGNAAGIAEKQDTNVLTTTPAGTFAFRAHSASSSQGSTSRAGVITVTSGAVTGNEDVNDGGVASSAAITGVFNAPDATGRGTASLQDTGGTITLQYYVVNSTNIRFLQTDLGLIGSGRGETQSNVAYSDASLSGSYAFGIQGDTLASTDAVHTVGQLIADGNGNITGGAFDSVENGVTSTNLSLTGTYTVDSTGRGVITLTSSNGTVQEVFWLVSPSRAFIVSDDPASIADGSADLQIGSSFTNASLTGQFAFFNHGFDTTDLVDRVGTIIPDGAGNLTLTEFLNRTGVVTPTAVTLSGTYSVGTNGRATAAVTSLSSNLVLYMISSNDAYILQNDANVEIDGAMSKQ